MRKKKIEMKRERRGKVERDIAIKNYKFRSSKERMTATQKNFKEILLVESVGWLQLLASRPLAPKIVPPTLLVAMVLPIQRNFKKRFDLTPFEYAMKIRHEWTIT